MTLPVAPTPDRPWRRRTRPRITLPPPTVEVITRALTAALRDAGRAPATLPQVYVLQLVGWLRAYQHRVTEVQEEMLRWQPGDEDPRPRWLAALRSVLDPVRIDRPGAVPEEVRLRRKREGAGPWRDLNYHIDALVDSLDE